MKLQHRSDKNVIKIKQKATFNENSIHESMKNKYAGSVFALNLDDINISIKNMTIQIFFTVLQ